MQIEAPEFRSRVSALFWNEKRQAFVAEHTCERVKEWYINLPPDWFDNPAPFPDGTPRHGGKRTFMHPLSRGWHYALRESGFDLDFYFQRKGGDGPGPWGLRLQQYGGEIKPVKRRALTIPVTADARGRTVRNFETALGRRLFMVRGKDAKDPSHIGSLVWENPQGDLHAAYVLRKRAYVPPLKERRGHDAIPDGKLLLRWATEIYTESLDNPYL